MTHLLQALTLEQFLSIQRANLRRFELHALKAQVKKTCPLDASLAEWERFLSVSQEELND